MRRLSFVQAVLMLLTLCGGALARQQHQPPPKRAPRLTTEDVIGERAAQKTVEVSAEEAAAAGKTDSETKKAPADDKATPEEAAWRETVKQARDKVKQAERTAEEAELRVTDLRNQLGATSQTTRERNETAAELETAGQQLAELRREVVAAKQDLEKVIEHGREKHFSEAAERKPAEGDDKANEEHFRKRYAELTEKLDTANRRVQLYENRIREINQKMQNNSGSGDNFFLATLQQEKDDAQVRLDEAREAYQKAQDDIDDLKREAKNAGVPAGVFR
jgi:chromosome segregation ATPase